MLYFEENGVKKRFYVERDPDPWNPRTEMDGNIGTMILFWNRYELGDIHFNSGSEIINYLQDLVYEKVPFSKIIEFADEKEIARQLKGNDYDIAYDIVYYGGISTVNDLIKLLEDHADIVILPVYGYEHSGFTIGCSSRYPYSDRWDGGQAGFIYTDKDTTLKWCGEVSDWKETAVKNLIAEVEMYDQYLQGECYGYIIEDLVDGEWEETDSCWGFYSDKWGDELEEEIFKEISNVPFTHIEPNHHYISRERALQMLRNYLNMDSEALELNAFYESMKVSGFNDDEIEALGFGYTIL